MQAESDKALAHLLRLMEWDRDYAARAIKDYLALAPWQEPKIGPALRKAWQESASNSRSKP